MTFSKFKYDLETLPMRQKMLKAMYREDHQTVEALNIIRREYAANQLRIAAALKALNSLRVVEIG
jgi:hypothetical protein